MTDSTPLCQQCGKRRESVGHPLCERCRLALRTAQVLSEEELLSIRELCKEPSLGEFVFLVRAEILKRLGGGG